MPGKQILHHRAGTAIWHMLDLRLGYKLEQFPGKMMRGAAAARCVVYLGGVGAGLCDQLGERLRGNLPRTQDNDMRNARYHPDRDEILLDIVCEFWIDRLRYRVVRGTDEKSVTVWRRLGRGGSAHVPPPPARLSINTRTPSC